MNSTYSISDIEEERLIDIAVQAANARRRKPVHIQPEQSVHQDDITNVVMSRDEILQEMKRVLNHMEMEIRNSKAFDEYNVNLILVAFNSLKDDLVSQRVKMDTKNYKSFREFFIDNLTARLQQMKKH